MIAVDARLNAYRTGGIATYTRELLHGLARRIAPAALTVLEHRKAAQPTAPYFPVRRVWTPPHHRLERWALGAEIALSRFGLLHSPDFIPPSFGAKRFIITVHDLTFLHYPETLTADSRRYYNQQIAWAVQRADHILTVSESSRRDLVDMLNAPPNKITVTYEGAHPRFRPLHASDVAAELQRLGLPSSYLLHVGTWEPRKNLDRLAAAYQQVIAALPDAPPLVLVGKPGWNFDTVRQRIEQLNLAPNRLIWRSDVSDDELPIVYNGAYCTVTPSLYEGFGLPALEGMACGRPALVSNRSALPEVVGEAGTVFDPEHPDDIANALLLALTDSAWYRAKQAAALARASQFSWDACAAQTLEIYQMYAARPIMTL
ncbi:MAG: glycosyltransferase family 1 protein [Anaerolineae bacterium]